MIMVKKQPINLFALGGGWKVVATT